MKGEGMKHLVTVIALVAVTAASAYGQSTDVSLNGSRKSLIPDKNFTGAVVVDPLYQANEHLPQTGGLVTFAPGARSAWHTHPGGQILIVTSGTGWVQEEGGEKREIKPGDVIWTPPGVKHWHGATAATSMSHIAISNVLEGKNVVWMEPVGDEQYSGR
jgi:quercetin dioxygenase-like cupin family protein